MTHLSFRAVLLMLLFLGMAVPASSLLHAHPGRTAADGCHYCRTNCDKYGVPWNERHCHGGSAPARTAPVQSTPAPSTPKPSAPTTTHPSHCQIPDPVDSL